VPTNNRHRQHAHLVCRRDRLTVIVLAILVLGPGPYDLKSDSDVDVQVLNDHHSPADQFAAPTAVPTIDNVR
jgi:hypothetical protein